MKQFVWGFSLIILSLCISCKSDDLKKPKTNQIKSENLTSNIDKESTVEDIIVSTRIVGNFVGIDYHNSLIKTKSPKESQLQDSMSYANVFVKSGKYLIRGTYNFHEGGITGELIFNDSVSGFIVEGSSKYQFSLNAENELMVKKFGSHRFSKLNDDIANEDQLVNSILFRDNVFKHENNLIQFRTDGALVGFDDFNSYRVRIDFLDIDNKFDQIEFKSALSDSSIVFISSFDNGFLNLYKRICLESEGGYCLDSKVGELVYSLELTVPVNINPGFKEISRDSLVGKQISSGDRDIILGKPPFEYGCDCCVVNFDFNNSGDFFEVSGCTDKEIGRKGTFYINQNLLTLKYDPTCYKMQWNHEFDLKKSKGVSDDQLPPEYLYSKRKVLAKESHYYIDVIEGQKILVDISNESNLMNYNVLIPQRSTVSNSDIFKQ